MHRHFASLAFVAVAALAVGCGDDKPAGTTGGGTSKVTGKVTTAVTTPPTANAGGAGKMGTATIKGMVKFTGTAPEMKVPAKRKDADVCKDKEVVYNAVVVADGKLKDVLVRIANDSIKGDYKAPDTAVEVDQQDCMYHPRMQGAVVGQKIAIKNSDGTLHNVHTYKGAESWFNQAQPKGAPELDKEAPEDPTVIKLACDVHAWMRGFVVVSNHPFFGVSDDKGEFKIEKVPAGKYTVEAWHSNFGMVSKADVTVEDGKEATIEFEFKDDMKEPDWNKDEMKGLW